MDTYEYFARGQGKRPSCTFTCPVDVAGQQHAEAEYSIYMHIYIPNSTKLPVNYKMLIYRYIRIDCQANLLYAFDRADLWDRG